MENASDALIMAGQILIFLIALSVCISSFSTLRANVNNIISQNDEIRLAKSGDTYVNFIESRDNNSARVVNSDTVISSMYRATKENYIIYIKLNNLNEVDTNYISTMNASKDSEVKNAEGTPIIRKDDKLIKITVNVNDNVDKDLRENEGGKLYNKIKNLQFNEYIGEYQDDSKASTENKPIHRIITYVQNKK